MLDKKDDANFVIQKDKIYSINLGRETFDENQISFQQRKRINCNKIFQSQLHIIDFLEVWFQTSSIYFRFLGC